MSLLWSFLLYYNNIFTYLSVLLDLAGYEGQGLSYSSLQLLYPEHSISSIIHFPGNHSSPTGIPMIPKHAMEVSDSVPNHVPFPDPLCHPLGKLFFIFFPLILFTLKAQEIVEMSLFL